MPSAWGRASVLSHILKGHPHSLTPRELQAVVQATEGYSASDLTALSECGRQGWPSLTLAHLV